MISRTAEQPDPLPRLDSLSTLEALREDRAAQRACVVRLAQAFAAAPLSLAAREEETRTLVAFLLDSASGRAQELGPLGIWLLKRKYGIDDAQVQLHVEAHLSALAEDPLFRALLERTVIVDIVFERLCGLLRRTLLLRGTSERRLSRDEAVLAAAVARQAFNTEYIAPMEAEEVAAVDRCLERFAGQLERREMEAAGETLLLLAMYRPPTTLPDAGLLAARPAASFAEAVQPIVATMLHEPFEERRLAEELASLGPVRSETGRTVEAQYEAHPYPRWFDLGFPQPSLRERLRRHAPDDALPLIASGDRLRILVPGCGTGWHPLRLAVSNPEAEIVAFDLSRAGLAYALRMASQLQITNVTFLHGDLLDVSRLQQRFHHIDCIGVLHHLEDPVAGWKALAGVLEPGGTMRLGMNSRVGMLPVQFLRARVARAAVPMTPEAMRRFRRVFLEDPSYRPFHVVTRQLDFYIMSMFREMFWPGFEHYFAVADIERVVAQLGLRLLAFTVPPSLQAAYHERFPEDPGRRSFASWRGFEPFYAGTMKQLSLWVQQPA